MFEKPLIRLCAFGILFFASVSCERDVFTGFEENIEIENCKVFIESNPTNASIYFDGKNTGKKTPDTLDWLISGKNKITLKLELYEDTTETITLTKGVPGNLFIDFESNSRNYGKIECLSNPDKADIFFNGKAVNQNTPYTIKGILPGRYYVKYRYPLHRDDSIYTTVYSNIVSTASLMLEDTSKWVSYNVRNSKIPSNNVLSIAVDKSNNTWLGTDLGLVKMKGNSVEVFNSDNSIMKTGTINHLAVDSINRVWISTNKGLFVYNNNTLENYSKNLSQQIFKMTAFGKDGNIWAATNIGLAKYEGTQWKIFDTKNSGLKDNYVSCIAVDNLNRIWAASSVVGMAVFDGSNWISYTINEINLPGIGGGVLAIHVSNDGKVWVATNRYPGPGGPLICFDGNNWSFAANNAFGVRVYQSICSSGDKVFFGSKTGMGILSRDGTTKFVNYGNIYLDYLWINSLTVDNNGNLWLGTMITGGGKLKKEFF